MLIDTWKSRREPIIHNHVYRVSQRPRAATSDAIRDARKRPRDSFKQEAATRPIHHPVTVQQ